MATPTGVNMGSYSPSNTVPAACPSETNFAASPVLPPTPNEQLCACMYQNLTCVATAGISGEAFAQLFNTACDPTNGDGICAGIASNGTSGTYGAFSMCNATEQLSWAFNSYYLEQAASNAANVNACSFGGNATTQSPTSPTGTCASLVSQAGGLGGTATVTSQPSVGANSGSGSGSGSSGSGSGSGTGTGSGSSTTTTGAASALSVPNFDFGLLTLGMYVTVAAMAGAGIVLM